jgi:hypothetical protein
VHKIQPRVVPEIITRCGMRWWNADANDRVPGIVRIRIIEHNIGGFGPHYDQLRQEDPKSEKALVARLRASQQHTANEHMTSASKLIAKLFSQTPALESNVNHVKKAVFGVENGAPILPVDHPVYIEMAKLIQGARSNLCFHSDIVSHACCVWKQTA